MSGGSHDYLCDEAEERIREMAHRLAARGQALDRDGHEVAAAKTLNLCARLHDIADASRVLAGVWKAQEWVDSGDWSEDSVRKAMAKAFPKEADRG